MEQEKKALLEQAGIDLEEAAARFMNNDGLMLRFLLKFPQDKNFENLRQALAAGDAEGAFTAAHTLTGVAGNLSLKEVYAQAAILSDTLRGGDLAAAAEQMPRLEEAYRRVVEALTQAGG